jgi:hypothetical protein
MLKYDGKLGVWLVPKSSFPKFLIHWIVASIWQGHALCSNHIDFFPIISRKHWGIKNLHKAIHLYLFRTFVPVCAIGDLKLCLPGLVRVTSIPNHVECISCEVGS